MVSRENMPDQGKLARYAELVRAWAPKLDLVSPADLDRFEDRHIADSLRPQQAIIEAPPGPCVDVGSGAGLPGVPLAIVTARPWRLLEPRHRRAAFLEEVVRELDLDCEVIQSTAEEAARAGLNDHVVVTARALAPPFESFRITTPLLAPGGRAIVWHGPGAKLPAGAESWSDGIATMRSLPGEDRIGDRRDRDQ